MWPYSVVEHFQKAQVMGITASLTTLLFSVTSTLIRGGQDNGQAKEKCQRLLTTNASTDSCIPLFNLQWSKVKICPVWRVTFFVETVEKITHEWENTVLCKLQQLVSKLSNVCRLLEKKNQVTQHIMQSRFQLLTLSDCRWKHQILKMGTYFSWNKTNHLN